MLIETFAPSGPHLDGTQVAYGQPVPGVEAPAPRPKRVSETQIIPSVTLTERYDSNILYAPSGLDVGPEKWDFVTSVAPSVQLLNKNRYADTNLTAKANGSLFVNNPSLNFISTAVAGSAVLDGLVGRLVRGGKLQIADSFSYSPESPSFASVSGPVTTDNPFARGIVPVRADLYQNTAEVKAAYPVSSTVAMQGGYSYSLLRVDNILVPPAGAISARTIFFNSDYQAWSFGPNWKLGRSDQVSVEYKGTTINLRDTAGLLGTIGFSSHGAEGTYTTRGPDWAATISGGGTILESRLYATGALALSTKVGDSTQVQVIGSRQMAPGYFGTPGALISTTAGLSVEHRFTKRLNITGNANYAYNALAPVKRNSFQTYAASAVLAYKVSPAVTTSLQYSYTYFDASFLDIATQNISGYLVNRHFALFSITYTWN